MIKVFAPCAQVREITAQLGQPVTASWESLGSGTSSTLSSITLPEKQKAEVIDERNREDRIAAETGMY